MLHAHLALLARDRQPRPYRTFEIGHVFADGSPEPPERNVATVVAASAPTGEPSWRSTAFLTLKNELLAVVQRLAGRTASVERATAVYLHPGKTAAIVCGETRLGVVGVVDPRLLRAYEIGDEVVAAVLELEAFPAWRAVPFAPPSRFPAIERDLALVVDTELPAQALLDAVRTHPLVRDTTAFDEYRGAQVGTAKKSLAVRITLRSDDATLTDAQADEAIAAVLAELRARFGAVLRT
jgi:phenylalanyl-tRNA synthetase beta chain